MTGASSTLTLEEIEALKSVIISVLSSSDDVNRDALFRAFGKLTMCDIIKIEQPEVMEDD